MTSLGVLAVPMDFLCTVEWKLIEDCSSYEDAA